MSSYSYSRLEAPDILSWVWDLSTGAYVFMPRQLRKDGQATWEEGPAWEARSDAIKHFVKIVLTDRREVDMYFSVFSFTEPVRKLESVSKGTLAWLDLDFVLEGMDPVAGLPEPSLLWETSPGHFQAIWALSEPYDARKARILTDRTPGADKGGWHGTKVLRIPYTTNWKRGGTYSGRVIKENLRLRTTWDALVGPVEDAETYTGISVGHPQIPTRLEWDRLLRSLWDKLPLSVRYNLRNDPKRGPGHTRSEIIFDVAAMLSRAGVGDKDAFRLIWHAPWNKFLDRPMQLWRDVQKAYARAR
jgi:hypothetical protein